MEKATRRALAIALIAGTALTGCAQMGSVADGLWGGTKQVASWVAYPVTSLLRDTPETEYEFAATDEATGKPVNVVLYDVETTTSPYAGGTVELYTQPSFTTAPQTVSSRSGGYYTGGDENVEELSNVKIAPVDSVSFVRLNGEPSMSDWQNCEATSRGYWLVDAAGGRINPEFEVCMRNKGYVLETELATYGGSGSSAIGPNGASYSGGYAPMP